MKSSFKFDGYKIDRIQYETMPDVRLLEVTGSLPQEGWQLKINIRQPYYFKGIKKYIGGMDVDFRYPASKTDELEANMESQSGSIENVVVLAIGIAGVFSVEEGRFEKSVEEKLVKVQIPSILFPYLRSAITSIFAHAGLGTTLFPLINVQELAKNSQISIIEED